MTILITTSHRPSRRTRSFVKDLNKVIPGSIKVNRGKKTLKDLALLSLNLGINNVIIVSEVNANPLKIRFFKLDEKEINIIKTVSLSLSSVKLLREIPNAQIPLNIKRLLIDPSNLIHLRNIEGLDKVLKILNVEVEAFNEVLKKSDCIGVTIKETKEGLKVTFLCLGSMKICGPTIKIKKIIDYEKGKEYVYCKDDINHRE